MKNILFLLLLFISINAKSQDIHGKLNLGGATLLNLIPNTSNTYIGKDTLKSFLYSLNYHLGSLCQPYEINSLKSSKWIIRSNKSKSLFEVNGDNKEPLIFKINETEYLILNKKIYKLLN